MLAEALCNKELQFQFCVLGQMFPSYKENTFNVGSFCYTF